MLSHLPGVARPMAILLALRCLTALCWADAFDPPAGYYNSATSTGTALRNQLHNIIDGHAAGSYNAARAALQITDQDPTDPDRVILVYDRVSLDVSGLFASGVPGWDSGVSWNREHTWPRARGINSSGPDNSDLHQLRPSTPSVNSDRDNLNFGGAFGQPFGQVNDGGLKWYPGDADAGMIARQQFYVDVRYDGSDSATEDLVLVNGNPTTSGSNLGDLGRLLQWHYLAPPDDFERRRNHVIYTNYQSNRNPFIDRPELAWSVFVDQQNDSQVVITGQTPIAGATTAIVDLGRVLVGASGSFDHTVSLTKQGNDGTYFDVATSGDASSTLGRFNAFRTGGTDATSFDVSLDTDTSIVGQKIGTITIDNLDVTTQGGSGRGANDGDDQIQLTLDVLSHATPSFASGAQQLSLNLDFGTVATGSAAPSLDFSIFNQIGVAGFTSGLELDQIVGSGDASAFLTDLSPFGGMNAIDAGPTGREFMAMLDTSAAGTYQASYTLSFSDEDLVGELNLGDLMLTLSGTVSVTIDFNQDGLTDEVDLDLLLATGPISAGVSAVGNEQFDLNGDGVINLTDRDQWLAEAATANGFASPYLLGDANLDGSVDGSDFIAWNDNKFSSTLSWSDGNFNGDGQADGVDFVAWNSNKFTSNDLVSVPEPRMALGTFIAISCLVWCCRSELGRQT